MEYTSHIKWLACDLFNMVPLYESYGRARGHVEAQDEVDTADVEALLGHASRHQHVTQPAAKRTHHPQLLLLRYHRLAVLTCVQCFGSILNHDKVNNSHLSDFYYFAIVFFFLGGDTINIRLLSILIISMLVRDRNKRVRHLYKDAIDVVRQYNYCGINKFIMVYKGGQSKFWLENLLIKE